VRKGKRRREDPKKGEKGKRREQTRLMNEAKIELSRSDSLMARRVRYF
jgi:hypothetical protein